MGKYNREYSEPKVIQNITIDDKEIVVNPKAHCILGANSLLTGCTVIVSTKRDGLIVTTPTLVNCKIVAKKLIKDVSWSGAKLLGCEFYGDFSGCDFGPRFDLGEKYSNGLIENINFQNAKLDACRFFSVDLNHILLPDWPVFTIIDCKKAATDFRHCKLSELVTDYAYDLDHSDIGQVAICLNAEIEAKRLQCSVNELVQFLDKKPYLFSNI